MSQRSEPASLRTGQIAKPDSRALSARALSELLERESRRYPALLTTKTERKS